MNVLSFGVLVFSLLALSEECKCQVTLSILVRVWVDSIVRETSHAYFKA